MTAAAGRGEAAERWPVSATFSVACRLCLCPVHPRQRQEPPGAPSKGGARSESLDARRQMPDARCQAPVHPRPSPLPARSHCRGPVRPGLHVARALTCSPVHPLTHSHSPTHPPTHSHSHSHSHSRSRSRSLTHSLISPLRGQPWRPPRHVAVHASLLPAKHCDCPNAPQCGSRHALSRQEAPSSHVLLPL